MESFGGQGRRKQRSLITRTVMYLICAQLFEMQLEHTVPIASFCTSDKLMRSQSLRCGIAKFICKPSSDAEGAYYPLPGIRHDGRFMNQVKRVATL